MGYSMTYAAKRLGLSYSTVRYYRLGKRDDGGAVEIPRIVLLACKALEAGLDG